jgi:hypothetical protein
MGTDWNFITTLFLYQLISSSNTGVSLVCQKNNKEEGNSLVGYKVIEGIVIQEHCVTFAILL